MPRTSLELPGQVEHLSILDEDGVVDEALEPEIDEDLLIAMHRGMLRARRFDERLLTLQRQGRIGTFAPVHGQEAAQIGVGAVLGDDDWLVPSFRETAIQLWRGLPMTGILLFNAGYNEGGAIPEGQNTLPIAIPVGTQLPHAVGIAHGMALRGAGTLACTYFGDGATSTGDFHEAMNFAAVYGCPVLFVCQNNHWAISTPRDRQTATTTLAQKALAYGMPGLQVDGNDVLAVHCAATEAAARARDGEGPTLIECVTYRMSVHTTADDPSKYRDEEEVERWQERDPLIRFATYLRGKALLSDDDVESMEAEIAEEIDTAWDEVSARIEDPPEPASMFDHLLAEPPEALLVQRRQAGAGHGTDRDDNDG
ncbi:pyruvate dehydrogenase (acetyl-transferring) E1 component subunit alpha [Marinibaculum pumilum]|uniref:Pyruvate dehydrogenase E1 component subunit alpha n=1 Tax=Marinibaculum pumilum TaxID=1766165 RepID=A0ABV7KU74_9PROT